MSTVKSKMNGESCGNVIEKLKCFNWEVRHFGLYSHVWPYKRI